MPIWPRKRTSTISELVAELRRKLAGLEPGDAAGETQRGQLAGLSSQLPAPLSSAGTGLSDRYRAGFAAGKLTAYLAQRGCFDASRMKVTSMYAAAVTDTAATPARLEAAARALERKHTSACIYLARKNHDLTEDQELDLISLHTRSLVARHYRSMQQLFRWLAEELAVEITPRVVARYETLRQRRLERVDA